MKPLRPWLLLLGIVLGLHSPGPAPIAAQSLPTTTSTTANAAANGLPEFPDGTSALFEPQFQNRFPALHLTGPWRTQIVNQPFPPILVHVDDLETPPQNLLVTASSSNLGLLPSSGLQFSGSGSNRMLSIRPATNQTGSVEIGVSVRDEHGATLTLVSSYHIVSNTPPQLSGVPDQRVQVNTSLVPCSFQVGDAQTQADRLFVTAWSSNSELLPTEQISLGGTQVTRTVTATPSPNQLGSTVITITVTDPHGGSASNSFVLQVQPEPIPDSVLPPIMDSVGVWADYDRDGDLDVLLSGIAISLPGIPGGRFARIFRNNNDGTFHDIGAPIIPVDGTAAAWGDYDNDGDVDLLLTGMADFPDHTGSIARIYRNDGADVFTDIGAGLTGVGQGSASWVDFDNDGDLDLTIAGWRLPGNEFPVLRYRNAGSDTFVPVTDQFPYLATADHHWGDFDNDGDSDLLLASHLGTHLFRNDRGLLEKLNIPLAGRAFFSTDWADADNDGDLDILTSDFFAEPHVHVLRNNGNVSFTDSTISTLAVQPTSGRWGDFDNDGSPDILLQGQDNFGANLIQVFRYTSIGYQHIYGQSGVYNGSVTWVDINLDGNLDIFYTGRISNSPLIGQIGFYTNTTTAVNHPPTAPAGLDYFKPAPDEVMLTWQPANDPQRTPGLTYNVRVGRTPGGIEVVSPHADPATGRRHLLALGNAGTATRWRLRDLPAGRYYWSVQALDAAFVASPFSAEGTFVSTNSRPFISDIANLRVGADTSAPEVAFTISDNESPATELQLTAASSNPNLIPATSIYFGGTGSNRTAHIVPIPLRTGVAIITLTVRDPSGETASDSFSVTVYNTPPQITAIPNQHLLPGTAPVALPFTVSDAEMPPEALMVIPSSSNPGLVPISGLLFDGAGSNRTLTVTPAAGQRGATDITLTVSDPQGMSTSNLFRVEVSEFVRATTNVAGGLTGVNQAIAAWADYDNDHDLDLLFGGNTGSSAVLRLYRNDGQGRLADSGVALPSVYSGSAAWGDYDNDGDLDVLLAGIAYFGGGAFTKVFRNNGNGNFEDSGASLPPFFNGRVMWRDFDQDGRLDVLLSGTHVDVGRFTRLYRNTGSNSFMLLATLPGQDRQSVDVADFDRDGDLDLVLDASDRTRVYRNDGGGTFTDIQAALPPLFNAAVAWGDYDNDGWPDLALAGSTTVANGEIISRIYRNQGASGTFSNLNAALAPVQFGTVTWADDDNDGDLDLVLTGRGLTGTPITKLYRNSNGQFTELTTTWPAIYESAVAWGDVDGDSDLDLVLAGATDTGRTAALFRNAANPPNSPPTAPGSLAVTLSPNNDVVLSWQLSSDPQTTNQAGLHYNLRMGTSSHGNEVFASHADPGTGYRRLPAAGNAGSGTAWRIPDLARGDYFWSVQAIDTAFAGSPFAVEAMFSITNTRPEISPLPDLLTGPATPVTNLVSIGDRETAAGGLLLSAVSANTNLVPTANITFGGSGSNRTVRVQPAAGQTGSTLITVTVTDAGGASRSRSFTVTINEFTQLAAAFAAFNTSAAADWGDYDNDQDPDLLLTGLDIERVARTLLYRNNGDGSFNLVPTSLPGANGGGTWGDVDGDGDLDLLLVGSTTTAIYRNEGQDQFTDLNAGLPRLASGAGSWADYDNDGDLDVLLTGFAQIPSPPGAPGVASPAIAWIYRNNGNGGFSLASTNLPGVASAFMAWGDLDSDGDLDLMLSGRMANQQAFTRVYRNDGNGAFTDLQAGISSGFNANPGPVALGDYDQDGDLDLLANLGFTATTIFRNNGNQTFTPVSPALPGFSGGTVAWGDFDNDGWLDAFLTGNSTPTANQPRTQIFRNGRDGTFTGTAQLLFGGVNGRSACADFDKDGDLDFVLVGGVTRLFRNETPHINTAPNAPSLPVSTVLNGGRVQFTWISGTDLQTTNPLALGYNLRVGTTPGGQQAMPVHSDLQTGIRRLARTGNAGPQASWSLRLPPGTYYWSVQAIDPSLASSPFSQEARFSLSNTPPTATTPYFTVYEDASLAFTPPGFDPDLQLLTYAITTPPTNGVITGFSPNFTYRPGTNYFGPDSFAFTVSDGIVTTAPFLAYVTVVARPDVESVRLSLTTSAGGAVVVSIAGEPYQRYRIESSDDLVEWTELTNGVATVSGLIVFADDRPPGAQRFYRAESQP